MTDTVNDAAGDASSEELPRMPAGFRTPEQEMADIGANVPAASELSIEVINPAATDQLGGTAEKLCTTNFSARPRRPAPLILWLSAEAWPG